MGPLIAFPSVPCKMICEMGLIVILVDPERKIWYKDNVFPFSEETAQQSTSGLLVFRVALNSF